MSLMRTILLFLIALVVASPVAAQTASSRGTGSASYGLRLSADTRAQALNKAKVNALEAYIAETGAAKLRLFEARRAEFIGEIDRYVLSAVQLSDTEDKKAKTYTVTVRAEINTTLLQTKLDAGSAVAGATAAQRSLLTFLFMARSQDTVQSFQDKEYRRVDASSSYSENTREGDSFRGNSVSTNGSINQNGSMSVTSGGSTTARADNITWKVANAAEVNTAMTGAFSAAGYEVVEAEYVEGESRGLLSIERIRKDFSTGNDLAPATLRDTANGIRAANIPYIAVGTLDIGMRDRDPASGNTRVFVTVTGKVLDVTGRFPRTVSSVGPVQFSGTGPNETVARTNALQLAAEKSRRSADPPPRWVPSPLGIGLGLPIPTCRLAAASPKGHPHDPQYRSYRGHRRRYPVDAGARRPGQAEGPGRCRHRHLQQQHFQRRRPGRSRAGSAGASFRQLAVALAAGPDLVCPCLRPGRAGAAAGSRAPGAVVGFGKRRCDEEVGVGQRSGAGGDQRAPGRAAGTER